MTDTDRTNLRTKMLADATTHREAIAAAGLAASDERRKARAELARITTEMTARIADLTEQIRTHSRDADEADALVRSLTPRKPRSDKAPVLAPDTDQ